VRVARRLSPLATCVIMEPSRPRQQKAEEQFGEINALVNNAAGNFMARTEKLTPNAFMQYVGIVLQSDFSLARRSFPFGPWKFPRRYDERVDFAECFLGFMAAAASTAP